MEEGLRLRCDEIGVKEFASYSLQFPFDPTYGYSLDQLANLRVDEDAPKDFDLFWSAAHDQNETTPLRPEYRESGFGSTSHTIREVYFDSLGGFRIGGWLCEPNITTNLRRIEIWG